MVQEVNANGLVDSTIMEPPLAGVTVHLTDAVGNSISALTDDAGVAVFDPAASALVGGEYRVEADNPRPNFFYPAHAANGQSGPAAAITPTDLESPTNAKLSSTVEFVDVRDDTDAYVNTAFWYPPYYCQDNPTLCSASQPWTAQPGSISAPTEFTLLSVPYEFNQDDQPLATNADTGTVYGIAYDRENQRIFSSAYAKRGSPYGTGGPGAIYVTDLSGTSYPLTGTTSLFDTIANAGADNHVMGTNQDYSFFDRVGKESLGDIDVTNDNRWLFGVNMFDKTVFVYDLADDSYVGSYPIPNPGCGDDWRPMGTGEGLDTSYVGGVCSGQTAQDMDEMTAHVYAFDPATGTFGAEVVDQTLAYGRGRGYKGTICEGAIDGTNVGRWFSWIDGYPSGPNEQRAAGCDYAGWISYPTPMLDDIVEETNGDLVISFRDRFADQVGFNAFEQRANGTFAIMGEPGAGGDIVRGCKLTDGSFVLDPNLTTETLAPSALCTNNNDGSTSNNGQPQTFREFYTGDFRTGFHDEAFYGGIALARSEPNLAGTGFDSTGAVWTQGIGAIGRGGALPSGNLGVRTDDGTIDAFGKGAGMADLEVLCDKAPIQIGNRVWFDTDADGVQDPGEIPVVGATVNIYAADGVTLIGTTTTSANGEYYFDQTNVTDGLAGPDPELVGLSELTDYVIRLDEPTDYDPAGPLYAALLTTPNAGEPDPDPANWPDPDELDSDGVLVGGFPQAGVTTGGAGQDDHSIDFGFVKPSVSVGDYVWVDTDRDGIQDAGEPGIEDVWLVLTDENGDPVVDVYGNQVEPVQTDENGFYVFPSLPAGATYTVTIDPVASASVLAPYIPTVPGAGGDPAVDSSTGSATSVLLPNDGDSDMTLDFGFVQPSVSVGDYVWVDTDRDGIQDAGEPGIEDVWLVLTDENGDPVVDVYGNQVEPVQTDENGYYEFPDLPAGTSYTVTIDPVASASVLEPYLPTTPGVGGDPAVDSSTGSATSVVLPNDGDSDMTLDFGFVEKSVSVGDYVWVDTDRDGIQDAGEPGIPNVWLVLTDANGDAVVDVFGEPVGPIATDANGYYEFPDLPAGTSYTVTIDPVASAAALAPYIPTVPGAGGDPAVDSSTGSATSVLLPNDGDSDMTLDFGFVQPSVSVGDYVWVDTDRDGIQDAGEPGIPNVWLVLTDANGDAVVDVFGEPVGPIATDANGYYEFPDLPAGTSYTVTIDPVASATALAPYVPTTAGAGGNRAVDSSTGSATSVLLPNDGDSDMTLDFGFVEPKVSVGDYVWLDADRDGIQDANEPGIGGVLLTLTGPGGGPVTDVNGNPVPPVRTAPDGSYLFDLLPVLPAGQHYTVTVSSPGTDPVRIEGAPAPVAFSTIKPTNPGAGSNRAVDSSTGSATSDDLTVNGAHDPTLDFGFVVPSVDVGGQLWRDNDGDAVIDPGEPPIPGVLLKITGPDGNPVTDVHGNPVQPVRTGSDGSYEFADLPVLKPGQSYTVSIVQGDAPTVAALDGLELTTSAWQLPASDLTEDQDSATGLDFGFQPTATPQPPVTAPVTLPPTTVPNPGQLPSTGGDVAQTLQITLLLLAAGLGLLVFARRRRRVL